MSPSKYQPLAEWLAAQPADAVTLTFVQGEKIVGARLPETAFLKRQWWLDARPAWAATSRRAAGWQVARLDLDDQQVTFRRIPTAPP
jgi:hypothetical protein